MKARLLVNPVSGTDAAPDYLPLINERLRARVGLMDIVITVAPGDATSAAAQAVRDGYDYLFVAGGDGTLNEALNGVATIPNGLSRTVFGIVPLGTGNDFATTLGIPPDIETALDALAAGDPVPVDVGVMNGRHFFNVSGGGFIAEVSDAVDTELKSIAGRLAYLIGGAQVLMTHEPVSAEMLLTGSSEQRAHFDLHAFAVCNARQAGGGKLIAPDAEIDDGLLDVCLIESMPTVEFLALLKKVSSGDHLADERVHYFRTPELELSFARTIKVNTDGQVLDAGHCEYRILHHATRVLRPPAANIS